MEIVPDDKDWTWVLDRPCPECGLDTRRVEPGQVAGMVRANAAAWVEVLATTADVGQRPRTDVWSPLEYACHVRDVFRLYDQRLVLMLNQDDPLFANWDQDQTAVEQRYASQHAATVSAGLQQASADLARRFEQVGDQQWQRSGRRSDGANFTVASFSRYFIHDPIHHLYDVTGRRA